MTQYSTDFTGLSGEANSSATTAITGFSFVGGEGTIPTSYWWCKVTSATNPVSSSGVYLTLGRTGTPSANTGKRMLWLSTSGGPGSLTANTDTEVLICSRSNARSTVLATGSPFLRATDVATFRGYTITNNGTGNDIIARVNNLGLQNLSTTGASISTAGNWFWRRLRVTGTTGSFLYQIWPIANADPGNWIEAAVTNNQYTDGYTGFGTDNTQELPIDVAWLGVGTGGDRAPGPFDAAAANPTVNSTATRSSVPTVHSSAW